jgi:hypothetical protein
MEILKAIKALALFENYTDMPRILEITYSVLFWNIIIILFITFLNIVKT